MDNRYQFSHSKLDELWDPRNDYELTFTEGDCQICYETTEIITQVGVERFGIKIGTCIGCLGDSYEHKRIPRFEVLFIDNKPNDAHRFSINPDVLKRLADRSMNQRIQQILDNATFTKYLVNSDKPYQCKKCLGYVLKQEDSEQQENLLMNFDAINVMRALGKGAVQCFVCLTNISVGDPNTGCSMLECETCMLTASKICYYCANGAIITGDDKEHRHYTPICRDLGREAAQKKTPLPPLRPCAC